MKQYTYKLILHEVTVNISGPVIDVLIGTEKFYAQYPFDMEDVSKDLIDAMIWILFIDYGEFKIMKYKWGKRDRHPFYPKARDYSNYAISYSGGVDSTAILNAFPEAKPIHLFREYEPVYSQGQMNIAKNIATIIPNDMERIRKLYGKSQGFNIGFGYISLILPLVDKMEINTILFGVIFDDLGFYRGDPFLYSGDLKTTKSLLMFAALKTIGINVNYPFVGLSEVWTTKIINESKYSTLATSCHVKTDGNICMQCFKCFRKQGILGRQLLMTDKKVSSLVNSILKKKPLKMAASTIYGIQKAGYCGELFDRFLNIDVSFLNRWNPVITSIYNSPGMVQMIKEKMKEYGIEQQTPEDRDRIDKFVIAINNNKLYE